MAFRRRLALLLAVTATALAVVWGRMFQLQMVDGAVHRRAAEASTRRRESVLGPRGRILDAKGEPLAQDQSVVQLGFSPAEWATRERFRCGRCAAVLFARTPRYFGRAGESVTAPKACSCGAKHTELEAIAPEDLEPLETALHLPPGALAAAAEDRMEEIARRVAITTVDRVLGLPTSVRHEAELRVPAIRDRLGVGADRGAGRRDRRGAGRAGARARGARVRGGRRPRRGARRPLRPTRRPHRLRRAGRDAHRAQAPPGRGGAPSRARSRRALPRLSSRARARALVSPRGAPRAADRHHRSPSPVARRSRPSGRGTAPTRSSRAPASGAWGSRCVTTRTCAGCRACSSARRTRAARSPTCVSSGRPSAGRTSGPTSTPTRAPRRTAPSPRPRRSPTSAASERRRRRSWPSRPRPATSGSGPRRRSTTSTAVGRPSRSGSATTTVRPTTSTRARSWPTRPPTRPTSPPSPRSPASRSLASPASRSSRAVR